MPSAAAVSSRVARCAHVATAERRSAKLGAHTGRSAFALAVPRVSVHAKASRNNMVCMSAATDEIVEKLKTLSLLEAAELVKQIEETFGVDASAPAGGVMMAAPGAAAPAEEAEVQTEFNLVITDVDSSKRIAAIKVVRSLTSLGLKEAKDAVTNLPFTLLEAKSKEDCEAAMKQLEETGCKCELK